MNGKEGPGIFAGELAIDADDPGRVYHVNLYDRELPIDYHANNLGAEASFDDVSIIATEVETQLRENQVLLYNNFSLILICWCIMFVAVGTCVGRGI